MKKPLRTWWKKIQEVADSYSDKPAQHIDFNIREKMYEISCAIQDLLEILEKE